MQIVEAFFMFMYDFFLLLFTKFEFTNVQF